MNQQILDVVVGHFDLGAIKHTYKLENGLINESYRVSTDQGEFIAQALNGKLWDERVIKDYCSVQRYLRTKDVFVPVLLGGRDGSHGLTHQGTLWRTFEYKPHDKISCVTPEIAYEAGRLLGKFHALMKESSFTPQFTLEGFHDTPRILEKLQTTAHLQRYRGKSAVVQKEFNFLKEHLPSHYLPAHHDTFVIHGDPKLDNFLFHGGKAVALLDLDTMMKASPLLDIGDAFRSWCRRKPSTAEFLPDVFESVYQGYFSTAPLQYSFQGVKSAMGLITLELAARYLTDYFEESYFSHKSDKYATRAEQNLARCRNYISYYHNFMNHEFPYTRDD